MLESNLKVLGSTIQRLYDMVRSKDGWVYKVPEFTFDGLPSAQSIAELLGVLYKPNHDHSTEYTATASDGILKLEHLLPESPADLRSSVEEASAQGTDLVEIPDFWDWPASLALIESYNKTELEQYSTLSQPLLPCHLSMGTVLCTDQQGTELQESPYDVLDWSTERPSLLAGSLLSACNDSPTCFTHEHVASCYEQVMAKDLFDAIDPIGSSDTDFTYFQESFAIPGCDILQAESDDQLFNPFQPSASRGWEGEGMADFWQEDNLSNQWPT